MDQLSTALHSAWSMCNGERRRRMQVLRREVQQHDLDWWVDTFLQASSVTSAETRDPRANGRERY
jgi:trehalose-6-phosphate synthase